jgi:hypothetical protein
MNYRVFAFFFILFSAIILFNCTRPIQKKLAGNWKVENVQFETSIPLDPAQVESSRESAKSINYELLDDYTAKIHAGFSVLEGNWIYKEADKSVYMVFSGTSDTILLGRYEEDKLINEEYKPDLKITTIFVKEDK